MDFFDYVKENQQNEIQLALSTMGIDTYPQSVTQGSSVITYHFLLKRISDYNKLSRAMKPLSAFLRTKCNVVESEVAHFAIEVERTDRMFYALEVFANDLDKYEFIAGVNQSGNPIKVKLDDLPHLLIAGQTGAGKSMALNSIMVQLLKFNTPKDIKFVILDGKEVELNEYRKLKDYQFCDYTNMNMLGLQAQHLCAKLVQEMELRYKEMAMNGQRKYNGNHIVLVIDEIDSVINGDKTTEYYITSLAKRGRACNIHLILATQRPVVKVITGDIQANIPSRIALTTSSARDSMIILGHKGAETLLGKGDAILRLPKVNGETHIQCLSITEDEVRNYIDSRIKENV
ncbi:MAG: DNA translocase FtsK [Firmicutes bacterium]|nr:DNA translocase FtsK [Candidatus Caballimonas caccae]